MSANRSVRLNWRSVSYCEGGGTFRSNLPLVGDFYWWEFITGEEGFWKHIACAYQHLYYADESHRKVVLINVKSLPPFFSKG